MSTSPEVLARREDTRREGAREDAGRGDARPAPWLVPGPSAPEGGRPAGYAAGYAAGWAQGAAAAAERAQVALDAETARRLEEQARYRASVQLALGAVLHAASDLEARDAPVLAQLTDALARTGLELATAVVGAEVRAGAGARAALLRALAPCPPTGRVTVRLHPADLVEVRRAGEVPEGVVLVADPALGRGDALAEHPGGSVDARLEQALERAADVLLGGGA